MIGCPVNAYDVGTRGFIGRALDLLQAVPFFVRQGGTEAWCHDLCIV